MDRESCEALGRLAAVCAIHNPSLRASQVTESPRRWLAPEVRQLAAGAEGDRVTSLLDSLGNDLPNASINSTDQLYFFYSGYHRELHRT